MAKPITKWAVMIESAVQLPETLEKAYQIAISGLRVILPSASAANAAACS